MLTNFFLRLAAHVYFVAIISIWELFNFSINTVTDTLKSRKCSLTLQTDRSNFWEILMLIISYTMMSSWNDVQQ